MNNDGLILDNEPDITSVTERKKLPVFLKVLCILTFVGSALSIFIGVMGIYFVGDMLGTFSDRTNFPSNSEPFFNNIANYYRWLLYFCYSLVLGSVLNIAGAILMLFRKKAGFFIYVAGEALVLALFIPVLIAAQSFGKASVIELAIQLVPVLISIVFIIMYSLNFKSLSRR